MPDANGTPWAKVSDTSEGCCLIPDDGFTCMGQGDAKLVHRDGGGLWIPCQEGKHYLDGQLTDDDEYIGLYHASE